MATTDLFKAVLPPEGEGVYCIIGLKEEGYPKQFFVDTLAEAEQHINDLLADSRNVYFGCAKYINITDGRTQKNSDFFKSFWIDIDCGLGKPYATQADGLTALKEFCKNVHLPLPTVVNSGRGIHAYWILSSTITRAEWKPVAERIKSLCVEHEFRADPSRTADSASILRVPETFNYKGEPPLPVELLALSNELDYEDLKQILGILIAPDYIPRQLNEVTRALLGNRQSRFKTIMLKTMNGNGCKQLENIVLNQEELEEPLWRAGLSIAAHCVDADEAIHKISSNHPQYSPYETEKKANATKGPYTCQTFEKLNPKDCAECPNKNKITSPIQLGSEIASAEENQLVVTTEDVGTETFEVPQYPFPYFRGKNGGVYIRTEDEDGNQDAENIYEHDLYIVKRLYDPIKGDTVWIRLHLPRDGMREFAMPQTDALTYEKLRDKLAWYGVAAPKNQMANIMQYVITFIKESQHRDKVEIMRTQFGWTEENDKFILGEQEISATGTSYSPPSTATGSLAEWLKPTGDFEVWKKTAKTYDRPGFEPHAFGFFTAFGAPLIKHLNLKGAIINLINNESGTGKSTILKMCNSVWGHPEEVMMQWKDTQNTIIHRLGILNNLPATIDEVTKLTPEDFSDLVYSISQGRGKNRMKQHENAERVNFTKWALIALCSSNASFYDKLSSLKSTPDGEFMRLIEYRIDRTDNLNKQEADEIFDKLYSNYGHAGEAYAKYLVSDLESAVDLVKQIQQRIDADVGFTSRERFWSGVVACNIAGALIAKDLGIIDFNIKRVYDWILAELKVMRTEVKAPAQSQASVIGEFMNEHRAATLVINGTADSRSGMEQLPIVEPKFNDLYIRIEPDTKRLFINAKQLRAYCTKQQITLKETLKKLALEEVYLGNVKKRITKGTKIVSPPVDVHVFVLDAPNFIDAETYIEAAKADTNADIRD
jgi:energy-coupling factor transporter ATP-binding protein EcfA2